MKQGVTVLVLSASLAVLVTGCGLGGPNERASSPTSLPRTRSMTVLHLGDSHTAADHFSGHLRTLFQQRFERGSRGMLPPGAIYNGYQPHQVTLRSRGKWRLFNAWRNPEGGPYGLSGYKLTGAHPDDRLTYETAGDDGFTHVRLGVYGGPNTGNLILRAEGHEPQVVRTRSDKPTYALKWIDLGGAVTRITLFPAGDGPVSLLSVGLERARASGVTYVSHGVPGATVRLLARLDDEILKRELETLDPVLIIVAFGTNEGFNDSLNEAAYREMFEAQLMRLGRLAPGARIAIAGPPDANRLSRQTRGPVGEARSRPCLANPHSAAPSNEGAATYWSVPGMLKKVRQAQRRVAVSHNLAFWDWSTVMGGPCGMHDWANAVPPKAFADHVHMTDVGAAESARHFFRALVAAYGGRWGSPLRTDNQEMP